MAPRKHRILTAENPDDGTGRVAHYSSQFRKISCVIAAVGSLITFYTVVFQDVTIGRNGRPKPPLRVQLMWSCGILAVGLPGVAWGLARAVNNRQKTPWE